jgi:CIC family chloride channel protein
VKTLDSLREHLARAEALVPLVLLGAASGAVTGMVIAAFRWITERGPVLLGILPWPEGFETIDPAMRVALPVAGAVAIGVLLASVAPATREVGVVHVMERLARHAGRLPLRNAAVQFVGAAIAIGTGLSVGREGPVIHVGAASSSLLGQWLSLPNNSLRVLVACGTAAGIGASFDAPLAGVIFAMEVVMMEYSIIGFTPVIIAAVVATSVTRVTHGDDPGLTFPTLQMASLLEIPYMLLVGGCIGALGSALIHATETLGRSFEEVGLVSRLGLAGLATAACATIAPQVMGIGYDTVELALLGQIGLVGLATIAAAKLAATAVCIGLGVPGGIIGPTLVIGATAGAALGALGHALLPATSSSPALYGILGMGAMMGATLQAPLAALVAILELTGNPNIILPGMVAIVTANLTSRLLFKKDSVFVTMLRTHGVEYRNDPVAVSLDRTAVGAVMDRRIATLERHCTRGSRRAPAWSRWRPCPAAHRTRWRMPGRAPRSRPHPTGRSICSSSTTSSRPSRRSGSRRRCARPWRHSSDAARRWC